jgi:gluconokinase
MSLPHAIVVCGVAGSGKSTVAKGLADALGGGFRFIEGDHHHPSSNVAKMKRGEPLTDEDRVEWLTRISESIAGSSGPVVVACSALRAAHRERIARFRIQFVLLNVDKSTVRRRIEQRTDHFFPSSLVDSQFDALEIADDVRVVEVGTDDGVDVVVSRVLGFYRCE